jgi:hypothetical protein
MLPLMVVGLFSSLRKVTRLRQLNNQAKPVVSESNTRTHARRYFKEVFYLIRKGSIRECTSTTLGCREGQLVRRTSNPQGGQTRRPNGQRCSQYSWNTAAG